eukprot:Nitzschia sp. Nitz4//scaffold63_size106090//43306//44070//NITZ4_004388-RA/size106090-processed-gene-0.124-mRNA-1//1//CDS//3329555969//6546//frame0
MSQVSLVSNGSKHLTVVRHGQAQHNPRAEVARANGCDLEEFFRLMREDDALDASLTDLGREQATRAQLDHQEAQRIQLVVSSPLSRALETANRVCPPTSTLRMAYEGFREVNGDMLNGKRRTKEELLEDFPEWNFDQVHPNHDATWTPEMEDFNDAAERGYQGLCWLLRRPEDNLLLVSHGGLLKYFMTKHPLVHLRDGRIVAGKPVEERFDNCEVRRFALAWASTSSENEPTNRPAIVLTQLDDPVSDSKSDF